MMKFPTMGILGVLFTALFTKPLLKRVERMVVERGLIRREVHYIPRMKPTKNTSVIQETKAIPKMDSAKISVGDKGRSWSAFGGVALRDEWLL
jgi:hypothetical protein